MIISSLRMTRWPLVLFIASTLVITPVAAGLFGSIGSALGIGGAVGDGLKFFDGLVPGGGGFTDGVLGAGPKAAFGGVIKDWKDANSESIDKLGKTNDATVKKLVDGLAGVEKSFHDDLQENVLLFSGGLDHSISNLDNSLQSNIDRFDNSLNNQTGRLDTVFQKQTSSLFTFGRIALTVVVLGVLFAGLTHLATALPQAGGMIAVWHRDRNRLLAIAIISTIFLLAAWLWPDPTGVLDIRKQLEVNYNDSLRLDDFVGATYSASQLQVLAPGDPLIRSYDAKARAFRDLFYKPTSLLDESQAYATISALSRADNWHLQADGANDPDIASVLTLIAIQSFQSNADLMRAVGLANAAHMTFSKMKAPENDRWNQLNQSIASNIRPLQVDISVVREAVRSTSKQDVDKLVSGFTPQSLSWASPTTTQPSGYSPVEQMRASAVNRLIVASFYRRALSSYFDYQLSGISHSAPADLQEQACNSFRFLADWQRSVFAAHADSQTFSALLLSGPYMLFSRIRAALPAKNACPRISDSALDQLADPSATWLNALQNNSNGVSERSGSNTVRALSKSLAAKQVLTLQAYEALAVPMGTYASRKSQGGDIALAAHLDLLQWLSASTMLGLHASNGDSSLLPAAAIGFRDYGGDLTVDERGQLAAQYLHSKIY